VNLADTIQTQGFNAQLSVSGYLFTTLADSVKFSAVLEPLSEIETQMELGSDGREAARLHVLRSACPASLIAANANSQVFVQQAGAPMPSGAIAPVWKIVRRDDNTGDVVVKFTAVKVTSQDD
jgi:hypothetical protein